MTTIEHKIERGREAQVNAYLRETSELDEVLADPRCGDCEQFQKAGFGRGHCEAGSEELRRLGYPALTVTTNEMTRCGLCPSFEVKREIHG